MDIERPSRIDIVYATVVATPLVVLAIFAWLGSAFAAYALPFVVGALLGSLSARLMTAPGAPRWVQALAVLLAGLSIVMAALALVSPFMNPSWLSAPLQRNGGDAVPGLFMGGFVFLFFTEIFRRVALPSLYPSTRQQGQQRKREQLRDTLIISGLVVALVLGASLIFGVMALIAYAVGQFSG